MEITIREQISSQNKEKKLLQIPKIHSKYNIYIRSFNIIYLRDE
jgi:hypothetical protein